jgi:hypothetical protein
MPLDKLYLDDTLFFRLCKELFLSNKHYFCLLSRFFFNANSMKKTSCKKSKRGSAKL